MARKLGRDEAERIASEFAEKKWGREAHILRVRRDGDYYLVGIELRWSTLRPETDDHGNRVAGGVLYGETTRVENYIIQIGVDTGGVEGFWEKEEEQSEHEVHVNMDVDLGPDEVVLESPSDKLLKRMTERYEKKYGFKIDQFHEGEYGFDPDEFEL